MGEFRTTTACAVIAAAVALAGCSSGSHASVPASGAGNPVSTTGATGPVSIGSGAAGQAPDACGLLEDGQVAQAIDVTVLEHHAVAPGLADSACVWTLKSEQGDIANPTVTFKTEADQPLGAGLDTFGDATRGYAPVDNVGDKAAQGRNNEVGPEELVYLVDDVMYTVSAQVSGDPVQDEKLDEALAGVAIAGSFVPN